MARKAEPLLMEIRASRERSRRLVRAVVAMSVFAFPVLLLAFAVRQQVAPLIDADEAIHTAAVDWTVRHDLVTVLIGFQEVTRPVFVYLAATLVVVVIWRAKGLKARALWAFVTMMAGWGVAALSKVLVQRARPLVDDQLPQANGYSFPSGHAMNMTIAVSALVFLLWPLLSTAARRVMIAVAVVVVVAVGLQRILLGVHFPSDVVAGVILGTGIVFSSWLGFLGEAGTRHRQD